MSWRAITEDDFRASITDEEDAAVRAAMLASGQEDPFDVVARQVTGSFRDAIRSHAENVLHQDTSYLPEGAIYHAVAVIRFRLLTRFCSELITEDRRTEQKDAMAWLKEVRSGREKIEAAYGDGSEARTGGQIEVGAEVPVRQWTRRQQSGL
jgi:hypothetical protein